MDLYSIIQTALAYTEHPNPEQEKKDVAMLEAIIEQGDKGEIKGFFPTATTMPKKPEQPD